MKAALYTGSLAPHDATGHAVLRMQDILLAAGIESLIYCNHSDIARPDVRVVRGPVSGVRAWRRFRETDLNIFHYGACYDLFHLLRWPAPGSRNVVYFHGITPREYLPRHEHRATACSLRQFRLANRAHTLLHATEYSKELARGSGVTRPAYAALPLPIDLPLVPRPARGHDGRLFRLLHVGRLVQNKGLLEILRALRLLHARGFTAWELEVIHSAGNSDAKYRQRIDAFLAESGLAAHVTFAGPAASRAHLAHRYAAADLTVLATRHETYCLPLLESLRCGTPVVATTAGAVPEVAAGHALLVEPGNVEAFAAAIDRARLAWPDVVSDRHGITDAATFHASCQDLLRNKDAATFAERLLSLFLKTEH